MSILSKRIGFRPSTITLYYKDISWINQTEYLGVILEWKLTILLHITNITSEPISRIKFTSHFLKHHYIHKSSKISLLIRPAMIYASPTWSNLVSFHYQKLQVK